MGVLVPASSTATAGRPWVICSRPVLNAQCCCLEAACNASLHTLPCIAFRQSQAQGAQHHPDSFRASHRMPRLASAHLNVLLLPIMVTQGATGRGCRARPARIAFSFTNGEEVYVEGAGVNM